MIALLLTACSSGEDEPAATGTTPTSAPTSAPAPAPTVLPAINATQVVSALAGAGYECTAADVAYATCRMGAASVWVLTGDHPRPPVVSVHAAGPVDVAWAEISNSLPRVLELAHINQGAEIAGWFDQQKGKPIAQQAFGDWLADYSAEVGTEEPGVRLTLSDTLCKANCQAE